MWDPPGQGSRGHLAAQAPIAVTPGGQEVVLGPAEGRGCPERPCSGCAGDSPLFRWCSRLMRRADATADGETGLQCDAMTQKDR